MTQGKLRLLTAAIGISLLITITVTGQESRSDSNVDRSALANEVGTLKSKVAELEDQNRAMTRMLEEMRSLIGAAKDRSGDLATPAALTLPKTLEPRTAPATKQTDASVRWSELVSEGTRLKIYGLLRVDMDIDSQRPNNGQSPLFITSEDPRIGAPDAGNFSIHPRLTRFGVDLQGQEISALGAAKLSGKVEVDFANGGLESRQIIRIRHAYMRLNWNRLSVLGGQTFDLVSPLYPTVNSTSLMWNAGNVGDRRPQARVTYEPGAGKGKLSLAGGVGLTGAIDAQDLDANGFRDGEESARPHLQGRFGYSQELWVKDQSASIGISGAYGWMKTTRLVAGRRQFSIQLINLDYSIPLAGRVSLRGEGWWGRNLADLRGGAGQSINPANGREIHGRGGWSELSVKLLRSWSIHPGFTTDDPVDGDLPLGGRTRNGALYFGNRISPGGNFLIGADYLRWKTNYKGFLRGLNNRVSLFLQCGF